MQGQKGYVNDYVVIFLKHYINPSGGGEMPENVTWASFFEGLVRVEICTFGKRASDVDRAFVASGLARAGARSGPKPGAALCLTLRVLPYWGCFATQRGQARSPQ
ncbi:hypothetical protein LRS56_15740 [Pseudomonas poae]|nr:hypothetical protein LRS56_15740 [Pseudomonas poae]